MSPKHGPLGYTGTANGSPKERVWLSRRAACGYMEIGELGMVEKAATSRVRCVEIVTRGNRQ